MIKQVFSYKNSSALKSTLFFANNTRFFSTATLQRKNYYDILGLTRDATQEDIKNAYRELAKKYHPDVNTAGGAYEPNAERFKDVAEAYAILNITESRVQYDLSLKFEHDSASASQKIDLHRQFRPRGKDGNPIKEQYKPDSYAAQKQEILREQRKKFNIDEFGRFKGGVPRKGRGGIRGNSMGNIGSAADPDMIQQMNEYEPTEQRVDTREANAFKRWQHSDSFGIKRRFLWFEADIDYEFFKFKTYRIGLKWFRNVFLLFLGIPFLAEMFLRQRNRILFNKITEKPDLLGTNNTAHIEDATVVLTPSGVLKTL